MRLITQGKRWRAKHHQTFRYIDGPKLAMTCTRRGIIHIWQCVQRFPDAEHIVEDWHKLDAHDAAHAIARLVSAGYDPIAVADRLTANMRG